MTEHSPLQGRVALIDGATGPLGRALAVVLAEAGADLALAVAAGDDAARFAMNSIANELWALDRRQLALTIDAADPESCTRAVEQTIVELGRLDLLVTLPPASGAAVIPFAESDAASIAAAVERRLTGVLLLCHAAGAAMLEGVGAILNVASPDEVGSSVAQTAAEAGVLGLTQPLAREWAGRVAVNAVRLHTGTEPAAVAALALLLTGALPAEGAGGVSGQVFDLA